MKNTKSRVRRQVESKRKYKKAHTRGDLQTNLSICNDANACLARYSGRKLAMANHLITISSWAHGHQYTREYISQFFGFSIRTVSRMVVELERFGLVEAHRLFKKPNKYRLGVNVHNSFMRQSLVKLLPSLRLVLSLSFLLCPPFVPLINNNEYTKKNIVCFVRENMFQRRYMEQLQQQLESNTETVMIKSLKLTEAGEINLSGFPESAVLFADEQLSKTLKRKQLDDPFSYLCKMAHMWCTERGIKPDWRPVQTKYKQQAITPDTPRYEEVLIETKPNKIIPVEGNNYSQIRQAEREQFDAEMASWARMSEQQQKEFLRPHVYAICERNAQSWAHRYCPYPNAEQLVQQLIFEYNNKQQTPAALTEQEAAWHTMSIDEQKAVWAPLTKQLAQYDKQQRAHYLTQSGCTYAIDIVEQLISTLYDNDKENTYASNL